MLVLADSWVWDAWYADDGERFHAFTLTASRALGDPQLRHRVPSVSHHVSTDLVAWTRVRDALVPSRPIAFDDQGIWTGSVLRDAIGTWHLFFTGVDRAGDTAVQRIGHAVSADLIHWERVSAEPILCADSRYETYAAHGNEPFRDPWVFRDGVQWRMLITAHTSTGVVDQRGCIATAVSDDLMSWSLEDPLAAHVGLRQLEVLQTIEVDGRCVLVFCMCASDVHAPGLPAVTGTWTAPADSLAGPFHLDRAEPISVEGNYAGRLVRDRSGSWQLMAFVDAASDGSFGGVIGNPVPLALTERGTMQPIMPPSAATARFRGEA